MFFEDFHEFFLEVLDQSNFPMDWELSEFLPWSMVRMMLGCVHFDGNFDVVNAGAACRR